jgi:hypothetical protein
VQSVTYLNTNAATPDFNLATNDIVLGGFKSPYSQTIKDKVTYLPLGVKEMVTQRLEWVM